MDDPGEALRASIPGLQAVIRRRPDVDGVPPDVKWSEDDASLALERYDAFLSELEDYSGEELISLLRSRMDLNQYFRWVALMTLVQNGDYIDEVFFLETATVNQDHEAVGFYGVHGWDPDDIFSECHHGGIWAIEDPHDLLFCTESIMDRIIFADPIVYDAYVDVLEEVIAEVTPELFERITEATSSELQTAMGDAETRAAMVELVDQVGPLTEELATAEITNATATLQTLFLDRRAWLLTRIADYRASR